MKLCSICKENLSLASFSPDKRASDGAQSACKKCSNIRRKAAYTANPDKFRKHGRDYYAANKDMVCAINAKSRKKHAVAVKQRKQDYYNLIKDTPEFMARRRAYALATKEAKRIYDRLYRHKNKEHLDDIKYIWRANNVELMRLVKSSYKAKRRAQEKEGDPTRKIKNWVDTQTKVCKWCSIACAESYHLDHIYPLSKGGKHIVENLCISCPSCNLKKNAKDPEEFVASIERHRCDVAMLDSKSSAA